MNGKAHDFISLILLIISTIFIACTQNQIIPSNDYRSYANRVVSYENVYDNKSVFSVIGKTSFPSKIGFSDLSLGGGWIIVDMGEGEEIVDRDGYDLRVYESDKHYDPEWMPELYTVYISNDQFKWHKVGSGRGVRSFDIEKTGLKKARFVKIVGYHSDSKSAPGPDIEAIEAINMYKDEDPPEIIISSPTLKNGITFTSQNQSLRISGSIHDNGHIDFASLNGKALHIDNFGNFTEEVTLASGDNVFTLEADDTVGNTTKKSFVIMREATTLSKDVSRPPKAITSLNSHLPIAIKELDIPKISIVNSDGIAVIIGNRTYDSIDLPEVTYAINDAEALRYFLLNSMGFKDGNIIFHTNTTKSEMEMIFGIKDNHKGILYDYIKPNKSEVFIFYSGHGAPDITNNRAYFIPKDCNPSKIAFTGYALDVFYENISKLPARKITVVVDACFSGGTNSGRWIVNNTSPALLKISNPTLHKDNIAIITSTGINQVSSWYPEKRHGLFTYFFLKAISGEADINNDKMITYNEIYNHLSDRTEGIPYWAKRLHGGRVQIPTLYTADKEAIFVKY